MQAAEALHRPPHEPIDLIRVPNVDNDEFHCSPRRTEFCGEGHSRHFVDVAQHQRRTLRGKAPRTRRPDPRRGPGNHDHLACEPFSHPSCPPWRGRRYCRLPPHVKARAENRQDLPT
jgi:hypothetical protein